MILKLIESFKGKGHIFFMDGMYTSVSLFTKLSNVLKSNAVGSLSSNRLHSTDNK